MSCLLCVPTGLTTCYQHNHESTGCMLRQVYQCHGVGVSGNWRASAYKHATQRNSLCCIFVISFLYDKLFITAYAGLHVQG